MKILRILPFLTLPLLTACHGSDNDYDASGVFEVTEITVSAQGNGEIKQLTLQEGDSVTAGQTVGYIDTLQLHFRKQELQANLQALDSRRYDVACQIASLKQEIATQQREQQRYSRLIADNVANRKTLDDIESRIAVLQRQLAAQTETLEKGNSQVSAQVRMTEAQLQAVEDQIDKCILRSPATGTVLSKYMEPGELATQGRALFKVGNLTNMYLRVYADAPTVTRMKIGQAVKVYADEGENERREYPGTITWISSEAEFTPKTIQTRDERANLVYAVKVAVHNDGSIKRGMYGELKMD